MTGKRFVYIIIPQIYQNFNIFYKSSHLFCRFLCALVSERKKHRHHGTKARDAGAALKSDL
jgi:hypothetical protein